MILHAMLLAFVVLKAVHGTELNFYVNVAFFSLAGFCFTHVFQLHLDDRKQTMDAKTNAFLKLMEKVSVLNERNRATIDELDRAYKKSKDDKLAVELELKAYSSMCAFFLAVREMIEFADAHPGIAESQNIDQFRKLYQAYAGEYLKH